MKSSSYKIFLNVTGSFMINLSAGYFLAIYAIPVIVEKVNSLIACIGCYYTAYIIKKELGT